MKHFEWLLITACTFSAMPARSEVIFYRRTTPLPYYEVKTTSLSESHGGARGAQQRILFPYTSCRDFEEGWQPLGTVFLSLSTDHLRLQGLELVSHRPSGFHEVDDCTCFNEPAFRLEAPSAIGDMSVIAEIQDASEVNQIVGFDHEPDIIEGSSVQTPKENDTAPLDAVMEIQALAITQGETVALFDRVGFSGNHLILRGKDCYNLKRRKFAHRVRSLKVLPGMQ